jgi:hypothetical protein
MDNFNMQHYLWTYKIKMDCMNIGMYKQLKMDLQN